MARLVTETIDKKTKEVLDISRGKWFDNYPSAGTTQLPKSYAGKFSKK